MASRSRCRHLELVLDRMGAEPVGRGAGTKRSSVVCRTRFRSEIIILSIPIFKIVKELTSSTIKYLSSAIR